LLATHFINTLREIYQRSDLQLTEDARNWLRQQTFPGNIRELRNLVERTVLVSPADAIEARHFAQNYRPSKTQSSAAGFPKVGEVSLEEMEIQMIRRAMDFHRGNITKVSQALGITRSALYRRLQKYNIPYES